MTEDKILQFKQQLKKLKKQVKQLEAQRQTNRSWDHKVELVEMKKQKLKMKEILSHIEEHTLSTPLSEYEAIERWIDEQES